MADGCNMMKIKIMKKILLIVLSMLSLAACSKKDKVDVTGEWKLDDISVVTKAGETYGLNVYLVLDLDGSFHIYQQLQAGRYYHYFGTYTKKNSIIQGVYADGKLWGSESYKVSASGSQLKLQALDGTGEVTTYVKAKVPEDVKSNAIEAIAE